MACAPQASRWRWAGSAAKRSMSCECRFLMGQELGSHHLGPGRGSTAAYAVHLLGPARADGTFAAGEREIVRLDRFLNPTNSIRDEQCLGRFCRHDGGLDWEDPARTRLTDVGVGMQRHGACREVKRPGLWGSAASLGMNSNLQSRSAACRPGFFELKLRSGSPTRGPCSNELFR